MSHRNRSYSPVEVSSGPRVRYPISLLMTTRKATRFRGDRACGLDTSGRIAMASHSCRPNESDQLRIQLYERMKISSPGPVVCDGTAMHTKSGFMLRMALAQCSMVSRELSPTGQVVTLMTACG